MRLTDFDDRFEILQHLMIGSEGTLGFISEITYRTVPDHRHKACALLFFETLVEACRAVTRLKPRAGCRSGIGRSRWARIRHR